jgi:PAS domain S-box-containing protein
VRDLAGVVSYWNKGAERMYGWSSAEAVGRNIGALVYRGTTAYEEAQQELVEHGEWSGELVQFTKAGRQIIAECSWTLIRNERGQPRSLLVINTDVSARKRLEAQVFHAQRLESLGTLAGGLAHDFNNLLTIISSCVQAALTQVSELHPAREMLADADVAASRGAELVRRLLTFSRREESKRAIVKLEPPVAQALALLRTTVPHGVRVETSFDADVPEVRADSTQIQQVVMNLVTNGLHAMADRGGVLEVRLQRVALEHDLRASPTVLRAGTYARLVVADSGAGIEPVMLDRIFDPFFTTKGAGEGTGLGLAVVHGIVSSHEGGIVVRSTPGSGSVFEVYLPAAPSAVRERSAQDEPAAKILQNGGGEGRR